MKPKAVVLGGGVTGLTAGWKLAEAGYEVTVIESAEEVGGQARTIKYKDYLLDLGAHKIFTVMDHVQKVIEDLAGDDLLKRPKRGKIRYNGRYLAFPIGVKDMVKGMPPGRLMYLTASLVKARVRGVFSRAVRDTYEDWFVANYGRAVYESFVKEATEKIWGVASNLSADLARRRVTSPTLWEILRQYLIGAKIERVTSADYFYYPKYGCQVFPDRLAGRIRSSGGRILLSVQPTRIACQDRRIESVSLGNGEEIQLRDDDVLIATIPKRRFTDLLDRILPGEVDYALSMLRERNLLLVYIMLEQERVMEENWIFFPERQFLFNRLFEQKNCSPFMVPDGRTVLCAEMTCQMDQRFSPAARQYVLGRMIDSLHQVGLIDKARVIDSHTIFLEHAYPLWDVHYKERLETVLNYLDGFPNLYSVGRQGGFVYGGIADCIDIGLVTAQFIAGRRPRSEWPEERRKFDNYVVVD